MLRIAITGGLCSGKSLVADAVRAWGCPVVDADVIGHELLDTVQPELVRAFGDAILAEDGRVDRGRLAGLVFVSPAAGPEAKATAMARRRVLNQILHPRIMGAAARKMREWEAQGQAAAGVEAALLVEEGLLGGFDRTLLVVAPEPARIERFLRRGGTLEQARARIAAQWPDEKKAAAADAVVRNDGSVAHARVQVDAVMAEWIGGAGGAGTTRAGGTQP